MILVITVLTVCACSRSYYRQRADRQVQWILDDKLGDSRWVLPRTDIQPDRRSRFFDPSDPDCPPLPPDDPSAKQILHQPSGFRGAKLWKKLPETPLTESPDWQSFFEAVGDETTMPDGQQRASIENLSLAHAVELSLVHSREYQQQLENLYLSALSLTVERYQFQVRPLGLEFGEPGTEFFYEHQPDGQSSFILGPSTFALSRLFPSGAQLAAELVNNTVWLLAGPDRTASASTLAFSLVQPFLRNAGREIVLENLTQSERNVLYAVRDFARFRKQFFVGTITGGQVAGLQRFLRGFEFLAGGSDASSVGFFPVLLGLQQLRNRQYIVRTLEYLIDDLRAADADALDIARLESTLADTKGDLYADQRVFDDRVDQYKVQLGLPPDMSVTLDDTLLEPFEFVDPKTLDLEDGLRALARQTRNPAVDRQALFERLESLVVDALEVVQIVSKDLERLDEKLPRQLAGLTTADQQQLEKIVTEERESFQQVSQKISEVRREVNSMRGRLDAIEPKQIEQLTRQILVWLRTLSVTQIIARTELIPLAPFDETLESAVSAALQSRLDLMNQRGRVVDARRNLEIVADQLESELNLVGEATLNTKPLMNSNQPFDFRAKESRFALGLQLDTPLDRFAEQNVFRAAQIAYDQARRGYVGAEDNVKLEVRQSVRTLEQLKNSIVQRTRRVQYSARELDLAESMTDASQRGLSLNNALRNLNRAQDELIEVWLDYETTRLNLYRDMGTMEIDERGFWIDPAYQEMANEARAEPPVAEDMQ